MKIKVEFQKNYALNFTLICFVLLGSLLSGSEIFAQDNGEIDYVEFKGIILDSKSNKSLEFATISVSETNITTISNKDGEFLLKVPKNSSNKSITISYLGYKNKVIPISELSIIESNEIKIEEFVEKLTEINVVSKDADLIIKNLLKNRQENYISKPIIMKAFYRESIKKRRHYASLSEGVVEIFRRPLKSFGNDLVKLNKVRKSTDYNKLDTLVIKLQGGPYNNLNMDLISNKSLIFDDKVFDYYKFSFDKAINIDNRLTYVVNFSPNGYVSIPLYYGKLYIDAETFALSKAFFSLNLDDQKEASRYFVKKKPAKAEVVPLVANYRIDYRYKEGKWYFGYSRIELRFKIDWLKRLFNSQYNILIEMAITDWRPSKENEKWRGSERLRPNVILQDKASGFSDPQFWGEYNVIEPDKSIENAIKKIQRHLKKNE